MLKFTEEVKKELQTMKLQSKIVGYANIHWQTVTRWIKEDNEELTKIGILEVIKVHLNKKNVSELFEVTAQPEQVTELETL